ncbi:MAG: PKD domain-containing protein, partial [Bacteroidota bacterium]
IDMGPDLCVEEFIWPAAVVVTPEPVVDFTASDTVACAPPLTVNFQHLAPSATDFLWDFGDGNTATLPNPSHTYTAYGTYDVSLVVSNAQGCGNTLVKVGMIHIEPPQAAFIHDLDDNIVFPELWDGRDIDLIRGGCLPLDINFTDQSTSATPIVNWNWSFGDSTVLNDTLANPTHTYLTEGYFDVSLTITTADGCMSTVNCDSCIRAGNKPTALLDTTDYPLLQCCSAQSLFQNATQGNHDYVWYFVTTGDWDGFSINDTSNGNWDFGSTVPVFQDSGQFVSTMFYSYNFGCVDSFWLEDWTMLRPPYASAGIDTFKCQSNWPPGGTVIFDTSNTAFLLDTAYIDSVLWEFGDPNNSTSNEFYPTFTYPDTGAYWIGVTVWNFDNGCSCKTSGEQFLQIKVLPDTTFAINPNQGCAPLFVDISGPTDDVAAWDWYLGPGLTSTDQNPSFVLDSLGTYDVSLIVANAEGCADTVVQEDAIVVEGIDARLSVSDSLGCVPFSLTLADRSLSTSPIVSRTWDLGNGDVIMNNDSVITYTYTSAPLPPVMQLQGVPVVLSLTDSAGCVNSDTVWLRVIEPIPAYVADTVHRCDGDSLQLMALGGDSLGVSRLRYLWDFGGNDTSQSAMAERFFPTGGPHEISLTVTDSLGCRATRIDSIWVTPLLPTVDFSAFPIQATCPPLAVNFTDLSVAGSAPIVNWSWAFSDGGTSGLQNPARIFSAEGSYGVSLTITDSIGCTNTLDIPDLINLTGVLGDFVMSDDVICVNDSVLFTANSPNAGSYIWDFGDGTLGLGPMLYHTYYNAGLNIPTLIMKDSTNSCSKSLSDSLVVYPRPEVPMPPDIAFCDGGEVVLDVSYPGVEYRWNTGATHPMITVQNSGIFSVVLTDSITGCDADSSVEVLVHPLPEVSLGRDLQICEGDTVLLLAVSSDRIRDYRWNVSSLVPTGDDSLWVSPDRNLQIRTTVRDENGCMDRDSALITVVPFPEIDLTYEALCVGDTLVLDARPNNIPGNFGQYQWWQDGVPLGGNQAQLATTDSGTFEVLYRLDGCETMEGTEVYFNPLPVSNRYAEFLNCVYMGEPVQLDAGPYADYHWIHSGERTQSVGVVEAGRYYVDLFNIHGCATEDSFDIVDACPPKLYVPNAFTPNYDGHNEHFGWAGEYILEFHMMIFNRWGRKIYETRNYTDRWDGRFQGEVVPEGVYTYVVSWNGSHPAHRQMNQRAGTVTLYR